MRLSLLIAAAVAAIAVGPAEAVRSAAPTITVRSSAYGKILFDGKGRALYAFTRDKRGGKSTCYGACAKAWPPYVVRGRLAAGIGTKRSLIGTVKRRDGSRQVTYGGRPLYYYVHDGRGEVKCQNVNEFGGLWLVVRGSGKLVR
jgi:predicted lipoprotein with Yx(FWY)xxD motif